MNSRHREIRALLTTMAPIRAIKYVKSIELPEIEEACIISVDIRGKSIIETAELLHLSPEAVKKRRRRAYAKICDAITSCE